MKRTLEGSHWLIPENEYQQLINLKMFTPDMFIKQWVNSKGYVVNEPPGKMYYSFIEENIELEFDLEDLDALTQIIKVKIRRDTIVI